ncbi:MAG: hypothetical protein HS111_23320 [Kofleriaceae bacterium]|nr:hypothetical protein [Kofleriaceae bacterium]
MTATRLVARSDDSQLAYAHGGRLGLLDPALRELATIERPGPPRWLGFVGAQLALLDGDELIALDLPSLAEGARVALPPGLGALAVVGDRVALGGAGLTVVVARLLGRKIDLSDFTMTVPAQHVLPLPDHELLVVSAARTDVVDAVSKRVSARLHLPLPPTPREAGTTNGLRYVWTFTHGRPELFVVRLSDGRPFQQLLDAPVRAVHASVGGGWVVADTDAGPRRVHTQTLAAHAVDADLRQAACVTGGAEPALYWLDAALRLQRTPLTGQAVAPADGVARVGGVRMEVEPMGTLGGPRRESLAHVAAPGGGIDGRRLRPRRRRPCAGHPPRADRRRAPAATSTLPRLAAAARPAALDWRLHRRQWARAVAATRQAPPSAAASRSAARRPGAARRGALGGISARARALALLYGAWRGGRAAPRRWRSRRALWPAGRARRRRHPAPPAAATESRSTAGSVVRAAVARFGDAPRPSACASTASDHALTSRPDASARRAALTCAVPVMASARWAARRGRAAAIAR